MKYLSVLTIVIILVATSCQSKSKDVSDKTLMETALKICQDNIILDSHIDWPESVYKKPRDISKRSNIGDFDLVRANEGGLNSVLSVIYIHSELNIQEGRKMYDSLYNIITGYTANYPDKFAMAFNPEDVRYNFNNKLFSIPLCLENGLPIGNDLEYLKKLKEDGITYITLNHDKSNQISDSNFDSNRLWEGLSPFGIEVIKEMNRLGIMIDISHSTDSAVFQSLRHSEAPVVGTHSNCRKFTPGFERNLSDTLIKAIADKNGVIMVNVGSFFLDTVCMQNWSYLIFEVGIDASTMEGKGFIAEYGKTHRLKTNAIQVADHIEYIVKTAGIDFVGIGSDFDGIYSAQPTDLPDVSSYPVIVFELLKRGYSEEEIKQILSGNFLRVWNEVTEVANTLNKIPTD